MKHRNQPKFLENRPINIESVWEIWLDMPIWSKIIDASLRRKVSKSWVVRYCAFRFIREFLKKKSEKVVYEKIKCHDRQNAHRLRLCLYGEDEKMLRMAACEMGMTVSSLVRCALTLFLESVTSGITDQELFEHGIKYTSVQQCKFRCNFELPAVYRYRWIRFSLSMWWQAGRLQHSLDFLKRADFTHSLAYTKSAENSA